MPPVPWGCLTLRFGRMFPSQNTTQQSTCFSLAPLSSALSRTTPGPHFKCGPTRQKPTIFSPTSGPS
ncbi:hypothetical protein ATCV1_z720L [Acanthocystis turfacea chlorella virus 1]|uniref:Uncharacterized protein z720L n=1 Tax=Chlorovirus heliozoae TaxID=322019 RepID=A7K9Y0_9PHYC|nr:hypothetical protein ATCV1_z720L [Acanthocystis turfacea chlorella virus 1]ABT16854.1 hypothetical protein ATCV1_z720L [Acanthocystis turfacea chlorella virus 1]